jgi:hypothetical protein
MLIEKEKKKKKFQISLSLSLSLSLFMVEEQKTKGATLSTRPGLSPIISDGSISTLSPTALSLYPFLGDGFLHLSLNLLRRISPSLPQPSAMASLPKSFQQIPI